MDVQPSIDRARLPEPNLVILKSPYRKVITPILNYIWQLEGKNPENLIAVLVPQLIESRWYEGDGRPTKYGYGRETKEARTQRPTP